jgi:hypothetical protein
VAITPPPQHRADPSAGTRLKPSTHPERRPGAVNLTLAVGMHESQMREGVRATRVLGKAMMDVQVLAVFEPLVTDKAATLLPAGAWPRALRHGLGPALPLSPGVLEGRVIGGRGPGDQPLAPDPCPSAWPEGGMALLILKDPAVPSGSPGLAPGLLGSPPARLARVASRPGALSASGQAGIQVGPDPGRHPDAAVLTPAAAQRVHGVDQRHRGRAHLLSPAGVELPSERRDGARARLDQPLVAAARALRRRSMPDVTPQALEARGAMATAGFGL